MKAIINTIHPYFSLIIPLRILYCNIKCPDLLCLSIVIDPNDTHSVVYHFIIVRYSIKHYVHFFRRRPPCMHITSLKEGDEKLPQLHCYHRFSDLRDIYLTENNYENYQPKMTLIAKIWGVARGLYVSPICEMDNRLKWTPYSQTCINCNWLRWNKYVYIISNCSPFKPLPPRWSVRRLTINVMNAKYKI